jgi:hypothetical protein
VNGLWVDTLRRENDVIAWRGEEEV